MTEQIALSAEIEELKRQPKEVDFGDDMAKEWNRIVRGPGRSKARAYPGWTDKQRKAMSARMKAYWKKRRASSKTAKPGAK